MGMKSKREGIYVYVWASQVALAVKNPPAGSGDTRDLGSIPGSGRPRGVGSGIPLQYSCLENKLHRQRSLRGYSPQGLEELDTTEDMLMYR